MSEKQYPEIPPKSAMRMDAGRTADGAFANDAMPAGNESTPAPTIHLTRLKISLDIVAVPPPTALLGPSVGTSPEASKAKEYNGTSAA
jgi:hypothetical protein